MNLDGWSLYTEYIIDVPDNECKLIEERHYKRYIKEVDGIWYYQDVFDQCKTEKRRVIPECTVSYELRHSERVFYPYKIKYKMCCTTQQQKDIWCAYMYGAIERHEAIRLINAYAVRDVFRVFDFPR